MPNPYTLFGAPVAAIVVGGCAALGVIVVWRVSGRVGTSMYAEPIHPAAVISAACSAGGLAIYLLLWAVPVYLFPADSAFGNWVLGLIDPFFTALLCSALLCLAGIVSAAVALLALHFGAEARGGSLAVTSLVVSLLVLPLASTVVFAGWILSGYTKPPA